MATVSGDDLDHMESPNLDITQAVELANRLYGLQGGTASEMDSYDDKNFWLRPDSIVGNQHVEDSSPDGYTLKVSNSLDSQKQDIIEGQNSLLAYLSDHGVKCPRPVANIQGKTFSVEKLRTDGPGHAVRLLTFVSGDILGKVPWQDDFSAQAGIELAKINTLLDALVEPSVMSRTTEWSLSRSPDVLKFVELVPLANQRALVSQVLNAFRRDMAANARYLQQDTGLVHGDLNQYNIVVQRDEPGSPYRVAGVIDVGDCHGGPRVFEVALTAAYMAIASGRVEAVRDVLVGYAEHRPLPTQAVGMIRVCICARLCQSLVMGLRAHALDPKNTYVLDSQKNGWPILEALWQEAPGTFERQWMEALKMA